MTHNTNNMPSKGVDYYSFIATDSTSVAFSGPRVGSTRTSANNFTKSHLEIESSNCGWRTFTGNFAWNVLRNGQSLFDRSQEISSLTGNLDKGNLTHIMNTPTFIGRDYMVSYGLYDAGSGIAGLPNADQAWVTIVPNLANWMGDLVPNNSTEADQAFAQFVLAAAHDAGMNTMDGIELITSGACLVALIAVIIVLLPIPGLQALLLASDPQKIMLGLAMTQKESTVNMLNMGVRYFDFRPAYLLPAFRLLVPSGADTLYHTHLVIPGQRYDSFLLEVIAFLQAHPTEIVVIRTCSDGIQKCEIPSASVITSFAQNALNGSGIQLGDSSCFQKSISSLRSTNTRLILVQSNAKYDSYSDGVYETLNPSTIVNNFNNMKTSEQVGKDFTVLQCQGTATSITGVLVYAASMANWSTSPLMATKSSFDIQTLPWILSNALKNLTAKQNIMIMNDFIDGATTYTAYQLSKARFASQAQATAIVVPDLFLCEAPVFDMQTAEKVAELKADEEYVLADQQVHGALLQSETAEQMVELEANEEHVLAGQKTHEALLQSITAAHQDALTEKADVSEEDREVQAVLIATQKEAEDVRRKQEEVVQRIQKRLASLKADQ
ncbi:hypothetical protein HWV62_11816 [Athelia sp. TMB]|nr:hypothetical protein HWV62_11816 [Athelia sp. TMB]